MKTDRLKQSIRTAKAWAKVHLKEPIINKETGWPIEVGMIGLEHTLKHDLFVRKSGRYIDLFSLVRKFGAILKNAEFICTESDRYDEFNTVLKHKFKALVEIKGETEELEVVIKEVTDKQNKKMVNKKLFYNHKFLLEEIKKP